MKKWYFLLFILGSLVFTYNCSKDSENDDVDDTDPIDLEQEVLVSTTAVFDVTQTSAKSGGTITVTGEESVIARGVCWSTMSNPTVSNSKTTDGAGTGSFVSNLTSLTNNTWYHVRAYATTSSKTYYGNDVYFMATLAPSGTLPIVTTTDLAYTTYNYTHIQSVSASSGGTVSGAGITSKGVCWSIFDNPTIADAKTSNGPGSGEFTTEITGLTPNSYYFVRAYATNSSGTGYGLSVKIRTKGNPITTGTMSDQEGTNYQTVTIGDQTWMAENLRTKTYNDGSPILNITDRDTWWHSSPGVEQTNPAYCAYNNTTDVDTIKSFGLLYNWYVVNTGKVCPSGWHVPTLTEWQTLSNFLAYNDYNYDGSVYDTYNDKAAKSVSATSGWKISTALGAPGNNQSENNSTGFNAIPCGARAFDGYYGGTDSYKAGINCWWWSSDLPPVNSSGAHYRNISYSGRAFNTVGYHDKKTGSSIRCVKD